MQAGVLENIAVESRKGLVKIQNKKHYLLYVHVFYPDFLNQYAGKFKTILMHFHIGQ